MAGWKPRTAYLPGQRIPGVIGAGNFPDAPADGNTWGRRNLLWVIVPEEAPIGGQVYARRGSDRTWQPTIADAPINGIIYARLNGGWTPTIDDAPIDATIYGRSNGRWARSVVEPPIEDFIFGMHGLSRTWVRNPNLGDYVLKAGDTMTGVLSLDSTVNAVLGFSNGAGLRRWALFKLTNAENEDLVLDGSLNTGQAFRVFRVNRTTAVLDFAVTPTVNGIPIGAGGDRAYIDAQDQLRVLKTGDTMTGDLILDGSGLGGINFGLIGTNSASIYFMVGIGLTRWRLNKNILNDFDLDAIDDAGTPLNVFHVSRTTQVLDFRFPPTIAGQPIGNDRVLKSGDVMTGNLSIERVANAQLALQGTGGEILFRDPVGANRFMLAFLAAGGGDLYLIAFPDVGGSQNVFQVSRASQIVNFNQRPTVLNEPLIVRTDLDSYLMRDGSQPMLGPLQLPTAPTLPSHATNKAYVDGLSAEPIQTIPVTGTGWQVGSSLQYRLLGGGSLLLVTGRIDRNAGDPIIGGLTPTVICRFPFALVNPAQYEICAAMAVPTAVEFGMLILDAAGNLSIYGHAPETGIVFVSNVFSLTM